MKLLNLRQRGDTLVEVLVAMAVVSSVLGAAYVSANRSLQASRASQERAEAIKVAESQAEQVKVFAGVTGGGGMFDTTPFCIAFSGPNVDKKQSFGGYNPFAAGITAQNDTFTSYPSGCRTSFYNAAIKYTPPAPAGSLNDYFTIIVRWNRVGGGSDEVKSVYRIH